VLLEQRPATGIWGGLYSLPEALADEAPADVVRRLFGDSRVGALEARDALRHTFTHFALTISPWLLRLPAQPAWRNAQPMMWAPLDGLAEVGLPAPIRRMLAPLVPAGGD
jgi:A/G-specific adenine glycosylase